MFAQVRDMFKEYDFVTEGDVVEQRVVLVELAHVTDVGHNRHAKFTAKQADGDEFAHAGNPYSIHLNKSSAPALQIVLEDDAIWNVFTQCQFRWRDSVGKRFVAEDVVGMRWFFNPKGIDGAQPPADVECLRQSPLLIGIHHDACLGAGNFADDGGTAQISIGIR